MCASGRAERRTWTFAANDSAGRRVPREKSVESLAAPYVRARAAAAADRAEAILKGGLADRAGGLEAAVVGRLGGGQ